VTGGKLSVRYRQDVDHLVNVSPPSFKKGCGGIDLFGGSMSYLDADRLVDKFERIMEGALATYAYDLVLNVLCEPCAKELKSLEALVDRINQLQIDDCKATKALVAYAENETGIGDSEKNSEAISDFALSSGYTSMRDYLEITQNANNEDINSAMNQNNMTKQDMITGCPPLMRRIFFTEGTLLENLAAEMGIDLGRIELMKAMIGDIYISEDFDYGAIAACPQNNPKNIDAIIYGEFYSRRHGNCVMVDNINIDGIMYPSIFDWARQHIIEIANAVTNKEDFSPGNITFLNTIPDPVLVMITTNVLMEGDNFEAERTADRYAYTAALIFAHSLLRDLYNDLYNLLYMAKVANFNQTGGAYDCASNLSSKAQMLANDMRENVQKFSNAIDNDYRIAISEVMENSKYAQLVKERKASAQKMVLEKVSQQ
jgi:conjugative transfer pilus assembly protein TraH